MPTFDCFPRYEEFDPTVPVWCVTPNRKACMHRFFDTTPISPSGRYFAVLQFPFEDREPEPGEKATVVVIDLETGEDREVARTCGWEPQMGANINWGGSDHELYFNDVDTDSWKPFAWKLDPLTGEKTPMEGTVYHASPDGKWLISATMTTMRRTQPGYGVRVPVETARQNVGLPDDDGFYLTDTSTGKTRMIVSLKDLVLNSNPPALFETPDQYEFYGFHSKFNPQGTRLMLSIRAFPHTGEDIWDQFGRDHGHVRFAWVTTDLDGQSRHCAVGPEHWLYGGHHATWFPDGKRISMNLNIEQQGLRFVQVNEDGTDLHKMFDDVLGSGHPTVHPTAGHILTDTYTHESLAYGDGTIPLRWVNLENGEEDAIVRIHTAPPTGGGVLRIDPHPAWDRTWRYVAFNGFVGGTRRVYIADMQNLVG